MQRLFISILLLSLALALPGQQLPAQQEITLRDGQRVYGNIVAQDTGVSYTLNIPGNSTLILADSQVVSIRKNVVRYQTIKQRRRSSHTPLTFDRQGLFGALHLGIAFPRIYSDGFTPSFVNDVSLQFRGGYRFNPLLGVGLAAGLQSMSGGTTAPLLVEVSGGLIGRKRGPQYLVQAGWAPAISTRWWFVSEFRGGPVAQAAIGWRRFYHNELAASFLLGYRYQQTQENPNFNNNQWGRFPPNNPVPGNLEIRHNVGFFVLVGVEL